MSENGTDALVMRDPAAPAPAAHLALLGDEPDAVLERATKIAKSLAAAIRGAKLAVRIQGREYVRCEGWTTLAAMLRLCPRVSARRLDRDDEIAYEATCDLVAVDGGATLYSADAICSSRERAWSHRDEYAIRSMAQTRATAKACRTGLSFVMALAGYEVTPAEEMPRERDDDTDGASRSAHAEVAQVAAPAASPAPDPRTLAASRMRALGWTPAQQVEFAREVTGKASSRDYTAEDWARFHFRLDAEESAQARKPGEAEARGDST